MMAAGHDAIQGNCPESMSAENYKRQKQQRLRAAWALRRLGFLVAWGGIQKSSAARASIRSHQFVQPLGTRRGTPDRPLARWQMWFRTTGHPTNFQDYGSEHAAMRGAWIGDAAVSQFAWFCALLGRLN
jgi:hypothetical protein